VFARIATNSTALLLSLSRVYAGNEPDTGNTARVRRYRARRRLRVTTVIPLDVYEDDIPLLTRLGYLHPLDIKGKEASPEALSDAFQILILQAMMTAQDNPPSGWRERVRRLRRRLHGLHTRLWDKPVR
jgi:hypothetical protein